MPPKLSHIRLASPIHYNDSWKIQERLVRQFLDMKGLKQDSYIQPTVLTMQMRPVYTTGRRERGLLSSEDRRLLEDGGRADVIESLRGGQTTFHGPGQLVAYPILDLSKAGFNLKARCYVHLLEESIMTTLSQFAIHSKRTQHTGVWVNDDQKIAAIGIHLRRNITSHGIALNVDTDLSFYEKFIACGLADKQTTNMLNQGSRASIDQVTDTFVDELAKHLGCDRVTEVRDICIEK